MFTSESNERMCMNSLYTVQTSVTTFQGTEDSSVATIKSCHCAQMSCWRYQQAVCAEFMEVSGPCSSDKSALSH
jgi:hypothetical protein